MTLTIISMPARPGYANAPKGFVTDREASQAARLAGLDYRLSARPGDSRQQTAVTLRLAGDQPPKTRSKNARRPGRAGPAYVVGIGDHRFDTPILHRQWLKQRAERK
ncbi:MAG: hypothetical protein QF357_11730 [Dehalococcoidia bacterium]|jgi:hypothetical protein|nr:hypothetical protein [Dehalococcoidia bacterium]